MPLASIPTYATGDTIEASWANTLRDNGLVLDARTGGDPGASFANKFLAANGSTSGIWRALASGDFPNGVVPDAAMANAKVDKDGDTMSGAIVFAAGSGVAFGLGGQIVDQSSPVQRTLIATNNDRLDVFNEAVTTVLASVQATGLTLPIDAVGLILSAGSQVRDTASPERLIVTMAGNRGDFFSENGVTLIARLTDTGGLLLPIDAIGLQLSSGGQLRDTASPERTILTAAGGRFDLFNEGATVQYLQVDNTVFAYKGGTIWTAGNDGSGSGLDADTLRALVPGHGSGSVPISDGALNTNLNAQMLNGLLSSAFAILASGGNFSAAPTIGGSTIWTAGNDGSGSGLDADTFRGAAFSSFALKQGPTTYTGLGAGINATFDITTNFSPILTLIRGSDASIFVLLGTVIALRLSTTGISGDSSGTVNGTNKFTVSVTNNGPNQSGVTYTWVAFG